MSTNISQNKRRAVKSTDDACAKASRKEDRRQQFTRSPSIEKIIRFNAYICSQNYHVLYALLVWLKTSQSVLQSYAERCTFFVKHLVYSTVFYKVIESQIKRMCTIFKHAPSIGGYVATSASKSCRTIFTLSIKLKHTFLTQTVYLAVLFTYLQLLACAYFLMSVTLPGGFVFLLASMVTISYMNYLCLRFTRIEHLLKETEHKGRCDNSITQKYIRPKDILGKRTISSLNLF